MLRKIEEQERARLAMEQPLREQQNAEWERLLQTIWKNDVRNTRWEERLNQVTQGLGAESDWDRLQQIRRKEMEAEELRRREGKQTGGVDQQVVDQDQVMGQGQAILRNTGKELH